MLLSFWHGSVLPFSACQKFLGFGHMCRSALRLDSYSTVERWLRQSWLSRALLMPRQIGETGIPMLLHFKWMRGSRSGMLFKWRTTSVLDCLFKWRTPPVLDCLDTGWWIQSYSTTRVERRLLLRESLSGDVPCLDGTLQQGIAWFGASHWDLKRNIAMDNSECQIVGLIWMRETKGYNKCRTFHQW